MIEIQTVAWDSALGRKAAALRTSVFVEEQGFSAQTEVDEEDPEAIHLVAVMTREGETAEPEVLGTLRILDKGDSAKIGRVAVRKDLRREGIGQALMLEALRQIRWDGYDEIVLSSQLPVVGFYERLGFVADGPVYDEEGAPHVHMVLKLLDG